MICMQVRTLGLKSNSVAEWMTFTLASLRSLYPVVVHNLLIIYFIKLHLWVTQTFLVQLLMNDVIYVTTGTKI